MTRMFSRLVLVPLFGLSLVGLGCDRPEARLERLRPVQVVVVEREPASLSPGKGRDLPAVAPAVAPAAAAPAKEVSGTAKAPRAQAPLDAAAKVTRLSVSRGVERRQPVGEAERFERGSYERLYAYLEVDNRGEPGAVLVSFVPPGGGPERGRVRLDVGGSPRYRTWAYSRAVDLPGRWAAVVRSLDGRELARTSFDVE
jgi:hypothetical protein